MKESQFKMLPHSAAKVLLLQRYLERYLAVISNTPYITDVHLFDLFCGEGQYEGGDGSPLIFLKTIKAIIDLNKQNGRKTPTFHCQFNDIKKEKTDKLKAAIIAAGLDQLPRVNIQYTNMDYKVVLGTTVATVGKLKNQKAFVFIDPYGYKEVRTSDIQNLMISGKAEVLLFLPTQFMFRFADKASPESLVDFIDELMPKEEWPASDTGLEFIEHLTEAFAKKLKAEAFVDSFIIERERNQYFCLFFFTSHIYGFDRMLDAKWTIDEEDGRGWQFEPANTLFSGIGKTANTEKFEKALKDFLQEGRTNGKLYEFTIGQKHLTKHTNDILRKWQDEGELIITDSNGEPFTKKNAFYNSHPNYKKEPSKITIKRK